MAHVFLSYVREDSAEVDMLADALRSNGVPVWMDRQSIKVGQRWEIAIRDAVRSGDFFIACFSQNSVQKLRSGMNQELLLAVEELMLRPLNQLWFVPVLLSPCEIPEYSIGAASTLRSIQYVALYSDWPKGIQKILEVIAPERETQLASSQSGVESTAELIQKLKTAKYEDRQPIIGKLVAKGPSIVESVLNSDTGDPSVVMSLGDVLEGLGTAAVPLMIEGLKDPNHHVRYLAAEGFIKAPNKLAIPALLQAFAETHEAGEIHQIATALAWAGDPSTIDPMTAWLDDESDSYHYWNAARVLAAIGPRAVSAVPALISALQKRKGIDWAICDALGSIGDARAVPVLAEALKSGVDNQSILRNLGKFGATAAAAVPRILRTASADNRLVLFEAIGEIGDDAVPHLIEGLNDESSRVREIAAKALGNIGLTTKATIALKKLASDSAEPPYVTDAATRALNGERQQ